MSDTPRTDAAAILRDPPSPFQGQFVRVEFARQLERENATLREALKGVLMALGLNMGQLPASDDSLNAARAALAPQ